MIIMMTYGRDSIQKKNINLFHENKIMFTTIATKYFIYYNC